MSTKNIERRCSCCDSVADLIPADANDEERNMSVLCDDCAFGECDICNSSKDEYES